MNVFPKSNALQAKRFYIYMYFFFGLINLLLNTLMLHQYQLVIEYFDVTSVSTWPVWSYNIPPYKAENSYKKYIYI
jgi:hypothetical protein